ncbi:hypothetical protein PG994_004962 [Apiospora phragmitis]|uniref:Tail assembly chaperone n=1 Tax=Apiospora phragmitis TaxID=2905665 RepID=A0ABR1VS60_9PEZI
MEFTSQPIAAGSTPVATLSGLQYKPRTADEREADAKKNAPKYARQKTLRPRRRLQRRRRLLARGQDPWLRIKQTLPEFLEGHTQKRADAGQDLTGEELDLLATAVIRVAKKDLEGAGRDPKVVDDAFVKEVKAVVQKVTTQHNLPQSRQQDDGEDEEAEEEEDD